MSQDVIIRKLRSGEEIIGRFIEKTEEGYVISHARAVAFVPGPGGQLGVQLVPWMASAIDTNVLLDRSAIIGRPIGELPDALVNRYLEETSVIQLP